MDKIKGNDSVVIKGMIYSYSAGRGPYNCMRIWKGVSRSIYIEIGNDLSASPMEMGVFKFQIQDSSTSRELWERILMGMLAG